MGKHWDIIIVKKPVRRLPKIEINEVILPGLDAFIEMRKPYIKPPEGFEPEVGED